MRYFVATISPKFPKNYDQCKLLGLWGMRRLDPAAKLVEKRDRILFYIGGAGFVAETEAQETTRKLSGGDWKPYDPRDFKYGFRIKFVKEFQEPHYYKFPKYANKAIGIKSGIFSVQPFFEIKKWQYNNIVRGKGSEKITKKVVRDVEKVYERYEVKSLAGELINFEEFIYAPVNELGVILLFGKVHRRLGFIFESVVPSSFPDSKCRMKTKKGLKEVWVEFEYKSSNYKDHGHPTNPGCVIISFAGCIIGQLVRST